MSINFLAFTSFLNFLASVALAILVYKKCPERDLARSYAVFDFWLGFYSFFYFLWQCSKTPEKAMLFHQLLFAGVIVINQYFLHFVFTYLKTIQEPAQKWTLRIIWVINALFLYWNFSGALYPRVEPRFGLGYWPVATRLATVYIVYWHLILNYGFGLFLARARQLQGIRKEQIHYILIAFGIGYFGGANNWPMWFKIHFPPYLNSLIAVYAGIIAYAIIKHRLMDIRVVLGKTLEYSAVTGFLAILYVVMVVGAASLLGGLTRTTQFSGALGAVIIAWLMRPLYRKIQVLVDVKYFRHVGDPRERLAQLLMKMISPENAHEIAQAVLETLEAAFHPKWVRLYLRLREGGEYMLHVPTDRMMMPEHVDADNPWTHYFQLANPKPEDAPDEMARREVAMALPMKGESGLVGYLLMGEKKSEEPYRADEKTFVQTAISQAAIAYERILLFGNAALLNSRTSLFQDVTSEVVHEVKTPLANIHLPAQATVRDLDAVELGQRNWNDLLPKLRDRMKFIMAQAVKASDRIDAIRQFATLQTPQQEAVDLEAVIKECLATLQPIIQQHQVAVHIDWPHPLLLIQGNAKQLEIVFGNLIKNAVEATSLKADPEERHLWITARRKEQTYEVEIKDSGPGIKAANLPHLFEKHFTTKGTAGTGVGLHLSRQLIQAMKGTIEIQSEEGRGATFRLRFPPHPSQAPKGEFMKNVTMACLLVLTAISMPQAAQKTRWVPYKSNVLNLEISVPADWQPAKMPKALAFRYDDLAGGTAAVGVLKSEQISNIEEAANKEFNKEGRPADWVRSNARVAGMRAIKITGSDPQDSAKKVVHYFVETPNGVYLVQLLGSADRWSTFSPVFATILNKLKFF